MAKNQPAIERWEPIAEMASLMGLTVPQWRAVHERLGRPYQRKQGDGKTSPVEIHCAKWLEVWKADGAAAAESPSMRYELARAEMTEMQRDRMRGELVHVDDVKQDNLAVAGKIRAAVEKLCSKCRQHWQENVIGILAEAWGIDGISEPESAGPALRIAGDSGAPPPEHDAAAPADSSRVGRKIRGARKRAAPG